MTKSDWPFGTVIEVKDRAHLGRGFVTKWEGTNGGSTVFVEFPHRDYSSWFATAHVKKIDAIELLGGLADE